MAEVSPLLQSIYSGDNEQVEKLLAEARELDVFEASALGRTDRGGRAAGQRPGARPRLVAPRRHPAPTRGVLLPAGDGAPPARAGAEVEAVVRNSLRVTPLHSAAAARNTETGQDLLERGADANARQQGGFTPIHAAAQNADADLYEVLVEHGADPELRADDGRTARDFAGTG